MNKKRIVIQGGYGAFHEIAAKHYFKDSPVEIIPRNTFKDLFISLEDNHADYGITAIENSLAGSIMPNYGLILGSKMTIVGEIYLRIRQNLVALKGQKIEDLKEVYSHPMAILQCEKFFDDYPHIRLIESIDTALSAQDISEKKIEATGAIASDMAAEMYGLEILAAGIETNKMNYTRFLILGNEKDKLPKDKVNKTSLHFTLSDQIGSLAKILSILSYFGMNLTKVQSMPIIGQDWEYRFYIDFMFNDYDLYLKAIQAIKPFTHELNILGEYMRGESVM